MRALWTRAAALLCALVWLGNSSRLAHAQAPAESCDYTGLRDQIRAANVSGTYMNEFCCLHAYDVALVLPQLEPNPLYKFLVSRL